MRWIVPGLILLVWLYAVQAFVSPGAAACCALTALAVALTGIWEASHVRDHILREKSGG